MFDKKDKRREDDQEDKKNKKSLDRGAKDDLETLKLVIEGHQTLKQRVLVKIQMILDSRKNKTPKALSLKDQRDFKLEKKKKEKEGGKEGGK